MLFIQCVLFLTLLTTVYVESKVTYGQERRPYYGNDFRLIYQHYISGNRLDRGPPPPEEDAQMSRYIVHNADWSSLATISTMPKIKGYPFANIFSISDGIMGNSSSGIPYLYITAKDMTVDDLTVNSRCSMVMTLAQGDYCKEKKLDQEDPRCAHVILSGRIRKVETGTTEWDFAKESMFSRHPLMTNWPKDHNWYFAKLDIKQICLMDTFGGQKFVSLKDYFLANPEDKPLISISVL